MPGSHSDFADAITDMSERFVTLGLSADSPDRAVPATPGWSIADVFGHVTMEPSRYRQLALGHGEWPQRATDLPAFNAEQIRTLGTRSIPALATKLRADTADLLAMVAGFGNHVPMMYFDGNQLVRADLALGTLLAEFVVHGYDLARALGRPWPIPAHYVPLVMAGLHQVLPGWVDQNTSAHHCANYEVRLRGFGSYVYAFRDGRLSINPPSPGHIDVHISANPVTSLLINYGRIDPVWPALTGKIVAWGRRPWLAFGLQRRFHPA